MGPGVRRDDTVSWSYTIRVIASEAKQSLSLRGAMDCFASLAMTLRGCFGPLRAAIMRSISGQNGRKSACLAAF